jgi:tetratricopeptide (TPR) repeat protein
MKIRQIVSILAILTMVALCVQPVAAAEDEATNFFNIAEKNIASGNLDVALSYFDQVLASNTTLLGMGDGLMFTYKDKSGVLTDLGRYDEAIQTANAGLALYKKDAGLWNNKGYALYKMGKYTEAVDAYNSAIQLDPKYLKGYINKGNALVKAGRGTEAVDAYTRALELDPGNTDATAGLENAKKLADSANLTNAAIVICLVIVAGLVIWYVKFRKTDDGKAAKEKK